MIRNCYVLLCRHCSIQYIDSNEIDENVDVRRLFPCEVEGQGVTATHSPADRATNTSTNDASSIISEERNSNPWKKGRHVAVYERAEDVGLSSADCDEGVVVAAEGAVMLARLPDIQFAIKNRDSKW